MKKILIPFCMLCFFSAQLNAQIANGSKAPNFTITDINGQTHTLYDELGQGKAVFIDFFATWCGSCWSYHQTHAFEDLFNTYGPVGYNWAKVYAIEVSNSTNEACISGTTGCSGGTQGNWTTGTSYPIANATTPIGNAYQITGIPQIMFVCPADTTVWKIGQVNAAAAWNAATNFCSTVPAAPQLSLSTVTPVNCYGESTGAIDINVGGNGAPFTYLWSNGATTEDLVDIPAGSYSVTVTAANTLTSTLPSVIINQQALPVSLTVLFENQPTCSQGGDAFVFASGGTNNNFTYAWSDGSTNQQINNLGPGTYTCTVSDGLGCTDVQSITMNPVTGQPNAVATALGSINCIQQNADLSSQGSSTGASISYMWTASNGGAVIGNPTNANVQAATAGTYTLVVTDLSSGCSSSTTTVVTENTMVPPFSVASATQDVTCANPQVVVSANGPTTGQYSMLWSTTNGFIASGETTLNATVSRGGTYTFIVSNEQNGCTFTESVTVGENVAQPTTSINSPAQLSCNASQVALTGFGAGQGTISYAWMTSNGNIVSGANTETCMVDAVGLYTLVVTDAVNGCTDGANVSVFAAPDIVITQTFASDVLCNGGIDGSVTVAATGGTGSLSYDWCNGINGPNLPSISAGTCEVTVTDADGCTAVYAAQINEPDAITLSTSATGISAVGASDGTATASASGGTGNFFYSWDNGQTGATISGLSAGTYTVVVTDLNGCTQMQSVVVNSVNCTQTSSISAIDPSCSGETGSALITVVGAAMPINYMWSSGQNTAAIDNLQAGLYSVSYTDANGCGGSENVTITEPLEIVTIINSVTNVQCANDASGAITVAATGGTGTLNYNWSNGQSGSIAQNLTAGQYSVVITDANGCSESLTNIEVTAADTEDPVLNTNPSVNASLDANGEVLIFEAMLGIVATDNCGNVTVTFSPTSFDCSHIGPNIVEVTATDDAGNSSMTAMNVTVEDFSAPSISCPNDIIRCSDDDMVIFDAPEVDDNCVMQSVVSQTSGLVSGMTFPTGITTQIFEVEDPSGNTASCVFSVEISSAVDVMTTATDVSCFGGCDGQAIVSVMGGNAPYNYTWTGNPMPNALCAGTYDLTVTDAMGCTADDNFVITQPDEISYMVTDIVNDIGNQGLGSISVSADGGIAPYTYTWTDANGVVIGTGFTVSNLFIGDYTVLVSDANGCTFLSQEISIGNTVSQSEPSWLQAAELLPNPTTGLVTVRFAEMPSTALHIQVMDLAGKVLMQREMATQRVLSLDLSAFPEGIYLVRMANEDGAGLRRVVVQR